jgi:hypothetical protein
VHEVANRVNHYIGVMPVLHIEQVVVQAVASERLNEILLSLLEIVPEILFVKSLQSPRGQLSACLPRETLFQSVH